MSWFLFHNLTFATWLCMACTWSYLRSKLQALALQLCIHTDVNSKTWRTDLPLYKSNGLKHITAWVYLRAFNLLGIRNACFQNTSSVLYSGFHKERKKKKSHSSIQWTVFEMGVLVCSRQLSAPNRNTHLTAELNWSLEECNGGKGSALANWHHPFVPLTASSCVVIHKAPLKWRFQPCCSIRYSRRFTGEENLPRSKQRTGSPHYSILFKRTEERLLFLNEK